MVLVKCQSYATNSNVHIDRFRFCYWVVLSRESCTVIYGVLWSSDTGNQRVERLCSLVCCLTTSVLPLFVDFWNHWRLHLRKMFWTDHLLERNTGALIIAFITSAFLTTLTRSRDLFLETSFLQCMPRRVPSYNPMALRIWRKLKRMGITSLQGIFLSLVFWSLFICLTYFIYTESTRFLAKIEAKKFDLSKLSKLGPGSMVDNGTLLARNFRRFDALGLFKTYWNNNSAVEDLLNYVKRRTQNISSNIPG